MTRSHTFALALAGALALPAAASAATVTPNLPCYVSGQPGVVALAGFAPNAPVTLTNAELGAIKVTTDATGSTSVPFTPPSGSTLARPGSKEISFTATEDANPAATATGVSRIAPLAFQTSGGTKSPKAKRSWYFSGWAIGKPIYVHFRYRGKTRANYRMGVATGPCGEYKRRAPGIAVRGSVRSGSWTIAVDQARVFRVTTKPQLKDKTVVFTTFRRRSVPTTSAAALSTAALSGFYRYGSF